MMWMSATVIGGCASSARVELEEEPVVTKTWVGAEPPPTAEAEPPAPGASPTTATTRPPVPVVTATTLPRPSAWVRPDAARHP